MDSNSKTHLIGYITMPPGHGKSYLHLTCPNLIELDTLVGNKETEKLKERRKQAKSTGVWEEYDKLWVSMAEERVRGKKVVIMVPSDEVGEAAGWVKLGGVALEERAWALNFSKRPDKPSKHEECRRRLLERGTAVATSNQEVEDYVKGIASRWN